ncbi:alpha/beta fold hydrolase [Phyllobacterium endophyticum]|uniref:alpha/beta fold hydrolase n=1 Tax=Phyllobacterium endophyticum TaxID=1149773 RepID=UPI0011CB4A20|nr:alpha/beta hydrolase [Phyllobacterium endophyticum]TXR49530.1 alpha/beta hydrolase [Phyllobacterium endophyticum]
MTSGLVHHKELNLDGIKIFYREAGPRDAPVILLPHGYPCSSYEFRNYMPPLADRWRLIAPDFPGCGYSDTPEEFDYTFDGYTDFLERFTAKLGLSKFTLYLHDFGSQIGLRFAISRPDLIASLIIQNGDIYEDVLGPKYSTLKAIWEKNPENSFVEIKQGISQEEFQREFLNDVRPEQAAAIAPDLWMLHWSLMTDRRKDISAHIIAGLKDNLDWFPRYQSYLRDHRPPTLIIWGPQDGYMPEASARAYLRDLPDAELHLLDGGHWLLETNLDEAVSLTRSFLGRHG